MLALGIMPNASIAGNMPNAGNASIMLALGIMPNRDYPQQTIGIKLA